ncbi:S-adenosylmethionine synthase [Chlamydiales bacterium STE3]|nr:S-adenosylmethionine synthase [Chlamydiales bacterium STE3]
MSHYLYTSESVSQGHPDKIADQISDGILDACLEQDPYSKVACETLVTKGLVLLAGEITTNATISYQDVVRSIIKGIGYDDPKLGFDYRTCGILATLNRQSPDIALGVDESEFKELGAGDQGLMYGYASDETPELMPLPLSFANKILSTLNLYRINKTLPYLLPDAKSQVTVEYNEKHEPVRIHTVILSTQHREEASLERITTDMKQLILSIAPPGMIDDNTLFYINPTGRFVIGGPDADTGLTGRKIIVDTYGGIGRHGGGAFSGKDPSKVDRSGAYAARYVAKNIIAAGLAKRCEVQISYAIGICHPISIRVDTMGTGKIAESIIARALPLVFDLTPKGMIHMLHLRRPIFLKTASGGHFGRSEEEFTWERTDRTQKLLEAIKQESYTASE